MHTLSILSAKTSPPLLDRVEPTVWSDKYKSHQSVSGGVGGGGGGSEGGGARMATIMKSKRNQHQQNKVLTGDF